MAKHESLEPDLKLAADAALELMKQLITLSAGVLALSATFIEKLEPQGVLSIAGLVIAWLALVVSLIAALDTISAIVKSRLKPEFDWSTGRGQRAAGVSKYSFVVGIALVAAVALGSWISRGRHQDPTAAPILYIRDGNP
jgi:hypothetical protein